MSGWDYRTFEQALGTVLRHAAPVGGQETLELPVAAGRVLAADIKGRMDIPPWDRSTVDGFAIRSSDTADGRETVLRIAGQVKAGEFHRGRVAKGECVRIATGAPMPEGTDASVMHERVSEQGGCISFSFRVGRRDEVSGKGADIRRGALIARRGDVVGTGLMGALSSQGITRVRVRRRPVVAVIPGGDEIASPGTRLKRGQIYDVNSTTIGSEVRMAGGEAVTLGTVTDDPGRVRKALLSAARYDAVVFSSGSSAGQRDFVAGTIADEGKLLFHGIRMRPGRPTMFGVVRGRPVFGLAGHPVSAFLGAHYFLAPCIRKMAGLPPPAPAAVSAAYMGEEKADERMLHILPVSAANGRCRPVFKESGAITSISRANGLVMQPAGKAIARGETVNVELLGGYPALRPR